MMAHGIIAATIITALIFWGSPRFRDANLPLLMAYAAVGLQTILPGKLTAACAGWASRLKS
jgi:heme A synthase